MRNRLILPAMLAVTVLLAGCAEGWAQKDDREVASLGTTIPGDNSNEEETASDDRDPMEVRIEFSRCMREHGVDMPDPGIEGGTSISSRGLADSSNLQEALAACRSVLEELRGTFEPPSPEDLERMRGQMLEFARCMREHGVDMPDPGTSETGGVTIERDAVGTGAGVSPDKLRAASEACAELVGGGLRGGLSDPGPDTRSLDRESN